MCFSHKKFIANEYTACLLADVDLQNVQINTDFSFLSYLNDAGGDPVSQKSPESVLAFD